MNLTHRPRRLRRDGIRDLVSETTLEPTDLIAPVFIDATTDERIQIESMPAVLAAIDGAIDLTDDLIDDLEATEPYHTLESLVARVKRSPQAARSGAIATFTGRVPVPTTSRHSHPISRLFSLIVASEPPTSWDVALVVRLHSRPPVPRIVSQRSR